MQMETIYGVMAIKQKLILIANGKEESIDLDFADGMIGAMPLFKSKKDALKYADGDLDLIIEFRIKKETL